MEEKIDRILLLLEDENIGVCVRMRKIEKVVYGNGSPGLAEAVRINNRNWAVVVALISLAMPFVYKALFS